MIGRILLCDNCHATDGARAAFSGTDARKADARGGIRRVVIGTFTHTLGTARPEVIRLDLCSSCRQPHMVAVIGTNWGDRRRSYGTFEAVSK